MQLWSVKANDFVEVPDDQVDAALKSGDFGTGPNKVFHVQTSDGSYGTVGAEDIWRVLDAGGRYESKAERTERYDREEFGGRAGTALALGAARGVSFGLSDWVARAAGMSAEELRKIEEYNAGASAIGEYGSLLIPGTAIAKGLKAISKIPLAGKPVAALAGVVSAPSVGASVLGQAVTKRAAQQLKGLPRIPDRAVAGIAQGAGVATEAALGGVGFALSEHALGRGDELAEELQSIGAGGLFGFALGGAIGSFKPMAKAMVGDPAKGIAEVGEKMVDTVQGALIRRDPAELAALRDPKTAEYVIEKAKRQDQKDALAGSTAGTLSRLNDAYDELFKLTSGPSKKGKIKDTVQPGYNSFRPALAILDDIAGNAQALKDADVLEQFQTATINRISGVARNSAAKLKAAEVKAANGGDMNGLNALVYSELDDVKRSIGKELDKHFKANLLAMKPQAQNTFKNAGGFYDRLRTVLEDEKLFGATLATTQREINAPWSALLTTKGTKQIGYDSSFLIGAKVGGKQVVNVKKVESYISRMPKEMRNPELAQTRRTLDSYLDNLTAFRAAVGKHYDEIPKSVDKALAEIQPMRESHKAHFQREQLRKEFDDILNSQSAALAFLRAGASLGGKVPVAGRMVEAAASVMDPGIAIRKRAELVLKKARAREQVQKSVERTLRAIAKPSTEPARALRVDFRRRLRAMGSVALAEGLVDARDDRELTAQAIDAVHDIAQPERMAQIIEEETKDYTEYPEHQAAIAQRISSQIGYLTNLVRGVRYQIDPVTGEREMLASDSELAKIAQGMEALGDPAGALAAAFETGTLDFDTVQAIRMLYPNIYGRFVTEVQKGLLEAEKPPSNEKRIMLSMLYGMPMTPYMQPAFVAAMQAVHGKPPTGAQQPRGYTGALAKQPERELLPLQRGLQA